MIHTATDGWSRHQNADPPAHTRGCSTSLTFTAQRYSAHTNQHPTHPPDRVYGTSQQVHKENAYTCRGKLRGHKTPAAERTQHHEVSLHINRSSGDKDKRYGSRRTNLRRPLRVYRRRPGNKIESSNGDQNEEGANEGGFPSEYFRLFPPCIFVRDNKGCAAHKSRCHP